MSSLLHSGHAYRAYDRYIIAAAEQLRGRAPGVGIHDPLVVGERLVQRIVELTLWPFVAAFAKDPSIGEDHQSAKLLRCDGLVLEPGTGATRIGLQRWLRAVGEFFVHWIHLTGAIVGVVARAKSSTDGPATLVFGIGRESLLYLQTDSRFVEFCRSGPIHSLTAAQALIVQAMLPGVESVAAGWVCYDRFPLHRLISSRRLGFGGRLALLAGQVRGLTKYLVCAARFPLFALLGRDLAYSYAVAELDRHRMIESVVLTNAAYSAQPLWMRSPGRRNFEVQMVWYSQNIQPMVYRHDGLVADLPNYRYLKVDRHWVWTPGLKSYLEKLGVSCPIHVIGPMLWYLPEPAPNLEDDVVRIVLFDITPVTDARANQIGLIGNYYCAANMIQFVEEAVAVCRETQRRTGRRIQLLLKHKRDYNNSHDPRYIEMIGRLTASGGEMSLVPCETNMYALLEKATLAIVVPYSSPAYVADAVGSGAVFFDPTCELLPIYEESPQVCFASGKTQLANIVGKACEKGQKSRTL